jgi:hypothetical protein
MEVEEKEQPITDIPSMEDAQENVIDAVGETFEHFFGPGTEEEQLRIREIAAKLNIRDNDAIWIIIYVLNYFGRFYRDLPQQIRTSADASVAYIKDRCVVLANEEMQRVKNDLGEAVLHHADTLSKQRGIHSVALPLAWLCCGIFVQSLLMFIAGAAVAGKGWGRNPFDAFLTAPAGWILPVALSPLSGYTIFLGWSNYQRTGKKQCLISVFAAFSALALAFLCFMRTI